MTAFVREVCLAAMRYFDGDARRIQHFVKVLQYATLIAEGEALPADEEEVLQVAAVLHDIGIPNSEKKYGCADGRYQQIEGVPVARELLAGLGADDTLIERVCHMIGLHHSYSKIGDDVLLRIRGGSPQGEPCALCNKYRPDSDGARIVQRHLRRIIFPCLSCAARLHFYRKRAIL